MRIVLGTATKRERRRRLLTPLGAVETGERDRVVLGAAANRERCRANR